MRIVIDCRIIASSTGRYVQGLLLGLSQLKDDDTYLLLMRSEDIDRFTPRDPRFTAVACDIPQFSFNPMNEYRFIKLLGNLEPDVVHFTMSQQPWFYKGNIVTTTHDLTMLNFLRPGRYKGPVFWVARRLYAALLRRAHKKSGAIIVPSKFVKQDLLSWQNLPGGKIHVVYEANFLDIKEKGKPVAALKNRNFLLYVGSAFPHKNLYRLVDAFALLAPAHPNLELVFAGNKPGEKYYNQLQDYVQQENIPRVHFLGWVSDQKLKWLYEHCAAYVFPSLSEGFGLPGLEAMAHSAPVLSSEAACLPEIYGAAAHYFNPESIDDMNHAVSQLLDTPKLRQKLISQGKKQVARYSWEEAARKTQALYHATPKDH